MKTMGHRIMVSRVGAADIRKSTGEEFVTEPAMPQERKRKLEAGLYVPQSWSTDEGRNRSGFPGS